MLCAIKHDNSKKGTETENCVAAGVSTKVLHAVISAEFTSSLQKLEEFIYRQVVPNE